MTEVATEPREGVGPAEFVRRLIDRGEIARVRGPLRRVKAKDAPRVAFMKDATVRGALRWLIRSGGWRTRIVVAGKRRREGRVWAQGIWEPLGIAYSPASLELVANAARWSQGAQTQLPPQPELAGVAPAKTSGDFLLFHLVIDALLDATPPPVDEPRPAETPAPEATTTKPSGKTAKKPSGGTPVVQPPPGATRAAHIRMRRALLAISPLTALFRADELVDEDRLGTNEGYAAAVAQAKTLLAPLVSGDRAVLLSYLDDALAVRWVDKAEPARRATKATEAGPRYLAFAAVLDGFAAAAVEAARPDALRPLIRFFDRYLLRQGQREAVTKGFKDLSLTLVRASDRARFLQQVAQLFHVSRVLAKESERVLALPFVDRTEEEKVYVADVSEFTRNVLPELEAIRRELAGEVG